MQPATASSLLARFIRRRQRPRRQQEPADMGTAFGMEQWLGERDHHKPLVLAAAACTSSWLPRWLRSTVRR